MGLPVTVLIETLAYWAIVTLACMLVSALVSKVRDWDRASVGLVAGTHLRWSEGTAKKIRADLDQRISGQAELDISPNASDYQIHMAMAADALTQLQKTMFGLREPVAETIRSLQSVLREVNRPGARFDYTHTGAGRYKFTYTEGTIND